MAKERYHRVGGEKRRAAMRLPSIGECRPQHRLPREAHFGFSTFLDTDTMPTASLRQVLDNVRATAAAGGLSVSRQLFEMALLYSTRHLGPAYYQLARFGRSTITFDEKRKHFNDKEYRRTVDRLNPVNYQKVSQNKVSEKAVLSLFGLPTADFIGFYHSDRGMDAQSRRLCDHRDLATTLAEHIGSRVCFKPVSAHGGLLFDALDVVSEGLEGLRLVHPITDQRYDLNQWGAHLGSISGGWIIEAYLDQHHVLKELNPDSLNTLRVLVVATRTGFSTRGAILRVGRKNSQVDNTSNGGIACPINLDTGVIREALDLALERNTYTKHPDSGTQIVGLQLPYWHESLELAERSVSVFQHTNFAGVDIAITPNGPCVIELNVVPDRRTAAHIDLPHQRLFDGAIKL